MSEAPPEQRERAAGAPAAAGSPEQIVLELSRALHVYGAPAHRLEEAMAGVARCLGLRAQLYSTPTSIMASFGTPGNQHTSLQRVEPAAINLERLVEVDALAERVAAGALAPAAALEELRIVEARRPRWGSALVALAHGVIAAVAARLFGGGPAELGASAAIGLVIGLGAVLLSRSRARALVLPLVAAVFASALAGPAAHLSGAGSRSLITLASLIVLIPGLALTVAVTELATRNLVSGTARLMGALVVFLQMGIGIAVGIGVVGNVSGRVLRRPVIVPIVPGILLLVPGSIGFRSLAALIEGDTVQGIDGVVSAGVVAMGITAGLLLANVAVSSRRAM